MNRLKYNEQAPAFLLTGFLSGTLFIILFYYALFKISSEAFTFTAFSEMHSSSYVFFIIDFIPFLTLIIAFFLFKRIQNVESEFSWKEQSLAEQYEQIIEFSKELETGNYSRNQYSGSNQAILSLEKLRNNLLENTRTEEKRNREARQRNWVSEGLAIFGEILRQYNEDINELGFKLISNLVKYVNANQGGFYLVENDPEGKRYLSMKASYAYDRRKFADKQIEWGEGIIGACAIEKKFIYLTNIPDSYLSITSGLGKSNPKTLLIVPMVSNEEVNGIIELASFNVMDNAEIDFVNKLAESISLSLNNIRNVHRTSQLLHETRAQADELKKQEEIARQNMEALKTTRDQAHKQTEKFILFTNSVNHTLIRAEYNKEGILLYANTKFLKKLGYSGNAEVENKHISMFIHEKDREWFNKIWLSLAEGGKHFEGYMKHISKQGKDLWTMATYTCIRKDDGEVDKILFLAIDTTEQKEQSIDFEQQMAAINTLNIKSEFSPDGKVLNANELFCKTLKYNKDELKSMNIFDFFHKKDIENFIPFWEQVIKGKPWQGQLRMSTQNNEEKWFRATFSAVNDIYDEVSRVIMLANEITNEKIMETENIINTGELRKKEELLRLNSIELRKKMDDAKKDWQKTHDEISQKSSLLESLLDMHGDIVINVDNTGKIVYINEKALLFFGIKGRLMINEPAMQLIQDDPEAYPVFIVNLFDASKQKTEPPKLVQIKTKKSQMRNFQAMFKKNEEKGKIFYSLILREVKE